MRKRKEEKLPFKVGTKVAFQWIETYPLKQCGVVDAKEGEMGMIVREAVGEFQRIESGGFYICTFEHSNVEIKTVPWAVKRIVKKRRKVTNKKSKR